MGQKVHPYALRLGIHADWKSKWFNQKKYSYLLEQDVALRSFVMKKLAKTGINNVIIERSANTINIKIQAARPGLIIGRGGSGIEDLKRELKKIILKNLAGKSKIALNVEIEEVRQPESFAAIVAANVAEQIEKRMPFRRTMKMALEKIMQNKEVQGAKIMMRGRLDGNEIARTEWLKKGKIPLQTLRSDIDYAKATAFTTYGTVGIRIWIYKGEKF